MSRSAAHVGAGVDGHSFHEFLKRVRNEPRCPRQSGGAVRPRGPGTQSATRQCAESAVPDWFTLEHHAPLAFNVDGLTVDSIPLRSATAKLDMDMTLRENRDEDGAPAGIFGTLEYPIARYDRSTIDNLLAHFQLLLESIVDDPHAHLSALIRPSHRVR